MQDLSLHILDIAENSIAANANEVKITLIEDELANSLLIVIEDNGKGMDAELVKIATSPFGTTRTTRKVGLGLPMLAQAAENTGGKLQITSLAGKGTKVHAEFQLDHIDRLPTGDLEKTLMTLIVGSPEIDFVFRYLKNTKEFLLDSKELRQELDGIPFCNSAILKVLRKLIKEGLRDLGIESPATVRGGVKDT